MTEVNPYTTPANTSEFIDDRYQPRIFAFNGRIGRLRYLAYSMIYNLILYLVVGILSALMVAASGDSGGALMVAVLGLFYIVMLVMYVVVARRRLNDLDKSGWLLLLFIVPIVNFLLGLYLLFARGTDGSNRFGPAPVKTPPILWLSVLLPIAVLGILAAIAIPAYQDYVERAEAAQMQFDE